jgi:hypothetical protein
VSHARITLEVEVEVGEGELGEKLTSEALQRIAEDLFVRCGSRAMEECVEIVHSEVLNAVLIPSHTRS